MYAYIMILRRNYNHGNAVEALISECAENDEVEIINTFNDCDLWIEKPTNDPNNRGILGHLLRGVG